MRALDRKLVRDLWRMRGQVLAVALVVACGVATLVMAVGAQTSLLETPGPRTTNAIASPTSSLT